MDHFRDVNASNLKKMSEDVISSNIIPYRSIVKDINNILVANRFEKINNLAITINNKLVYLNSEYKHLGLDFYNTHTGVIITSFFISIFKEYDSVLKMLVSKGVPKKGIKFFKLLLFLDKYMFINDSILDFDICNSESDVSKSKNGGLSFRELYLSFIFNCLEVDYKKDSMVRFAFLRNEILCELEKIGAFKTMMDVCEAYDQVFKVKRLVR